MVKLKIELPDDFFEEEIRSGYCVTREMKKIWAVELDLLAELQRVCDKYQISYTADGGTLLGAVRHQGFIPWDDDIDIVMLRKEYDKLCAVAEKEFRHPYFFQTEYTDKGSLRGHAQIRNSDTTGMRLEERNIVSFNQGIFIDIFPLDSVVENEKKLKRQKKWAAFNRRLADDIARCTTRFNWSKQTGLRLFIYKIASVICTVFDWEKYFFERFEKICQKYNFDETTEFVSVLSFSFGEKKHYKRRKDYEQIIMARFECLQIPIIKNYDEQLTRLYGNYHEFIKGNTLHGEILFDTEKSYKEYEPQPPLHHRPL